MEFVLTIALVITAVPSPSGIELERLADNSFDPPGVVGEFSFENFPPVPCGDVVLFNAITFADVRLGVYSASSAGVEVIANPGTPVPGLSENFEEAWQQRCAGGRVVLLGDEDRSPLNSGRSVYESIQGVISPILEEGIHLNQTEVQSFNELTGSEFGVAMVTRLLHSSNNQALVVKPFNGGPFIVADRTTILPGQADPVTIYSQPVLAGSDLVFHALTNFLNLGFYRWTQGQGISVVVDTQTPVPIPGSGNFGLFNQIASLDYGLVFGGDYSGGSGLFVARNGQVEPLVVPGQVTEGGETITAAGLPSGAGSLLSFSARTVENPPLAIYVRTRDGRLQRILGNGDIIEGQQVDFINASADRTSVAIRINRRESLQQTIQEVIYRATFPEPDVIPVLSRSGIAALALALVLAGLWVLRWRRGGESDQAKGGAGLF